MIQTILDSCIGLPERLVQPDQTLLIEGEVSNRLYVLIAGEVEVSLDGVRISTQNEPGSIFGEMSVLLQSPHTATVKGFAPSSRVYVVENAADFLKAHPEITFFVTKLLARRLKGATDYLADLKRQFEDQEGHLSMVDEVLASLLHQQDSDCALGSDRDPYPLNEPGR
jgi:CRP-like cAMP-binding protein